MTRPFTKVRFVFKSEVIMFVFKSEVRFVYESGLGLFSKVR